MTAGLTEKLIEVKLDSGELVYVQPLSHWGQQAILDRIDEDYPPPNPDAYQRKLEGSILDANIPLEANAEYQAALKQHRDLRNKVFISRLFEAGVVVDTPEGKDATLARYAARLAQRRAVMKLPADDWLACVMFVLVTSTADMINVMNAATLSLGEDEVRRALRSFRRNVQRH